MDPNPASVRQGSAASLAAPADGASPWQAVKKFISDDSLSITLFSLFVVCLASQGLSGWRAFNDDLRDAQLPALGLRAYLGTGNFLDGALSNWQAAVLQLAVLIAFSSVLRQKGAAHSKKGVSPPQSHRTLEVKIGSRSSLTEWLYANSLSLAFFAMFATTFVLHAVFGSMKHNEDQALRHLPPGSLGQYVASAGFWFSVFQTWEAEFAVIGLYIVLSIFLRQEGSSESKPTEASNEDTGETNK